MDEHREPEGVEEVVPDPTVESSVVTSGGAPPAAEDTSNLELKAPNWWHRDHPTFSALTGFFTGIAFLIVVPGAYAGILAQVVDYDRAEELFPFILLTLVVPIVLMAVPKTRRFGLYMVIGLVSTALVVGGVAALVLYALFATN